MKNKIHILFFISLLTLGAYSLPRSIEGYSGSGRTAHLPPYESSYDTDSTFTARWLSAISNRKPADTLVTKRPPNPVSIFRMEKNPLLDLIPEEE